MFRYFSYVSKTIVIIGVTFALFVTRENFLSTDYSVLSSEWQLEV